jgi:hypothetical protein
LSILVINAVRTADHFKAENRVSENAKKTLDIVKKFVEERCIPAGESLLGLNMLLLLRFANQILSSMLRYLY